MLDEVRAVKIKLISFHMFYDLPDSIACESYYYYCYLHCKCWCILNKKSLDISKQYTKTKIKPTNSVYLLHSITNSAYAFMLRMRGSLLIFFSSKDLFCVDLSMRISSCRLSYSCFYALCCCKYRKSDKARSGCLSIINIETMIIDRCSS